MERTGSQIKAFWGLRSFDCTQDRCATIKKFLKLAIFGVSVDAFLIDFFQSLSGVYKLVVLSWFEYYMASGCIF